MKGKRCKPCIQIKKAVAWKARLRCIYGITDDVALLSCCTEKAHQCSLQRFLQKHVKGRIYPETSPLQRALMMME